MRGRVVVLKMKLAERSPGKPAVHALRDADADRRRQGASDAAPRSDALAAHSLSDLSASPPRVSAGRCPQLVLFDDRVDRRRLSPALIASSPASATGSSRAAAA
jgi:hypothetical protein